MLDLIKEVAVFPDGGTCARMGGVEGAGTPAPDLSAGTQRCAESFPQFAGYLTTWKNGIYCTCFIYTQMEKKNFLFVTLDALITDTAWYVSKEGHEVKLYTENPDDKEVGDGFVTKIDDWKSEVDWADVIVFDDVLGQGKKADALRKAGKAVIGGTAYTDRLEDDRAFGQEELMAVGIPVIPHKNFTSFDDAILYVQENPGRYVVKSSGEMQNVKSLLFVGEEESGKDVLYILDAYKQAWAKQIRTFQLQKRVVGVEVAVGAFFNGKEFVYPINVNFEHKKLFPGDIGPQTGEMGCYDEETEVLTKSGWKFFRDVTYEDAFATLNNEGLMEYNRPTAIVRYSHHKKMIRIRNRATDLLVTPDHNMFGQEANQYRKDELQWGFVKAKDLPAQFVVPCSATWRGDERQAFELPGISRFHFEGRSVAQKRVQPKLIPMDDWLAFLGLWLAEGSTSASGYAVHVAQVHERKKKAVEEAVTRLPFAFRKVKDGWKCDDKQLWSYLRPLGSALTKFVPEEVKSLSPRQLGILFDHMCLGDGNMQKNGFRIYYTVSRRLADDAQELLLKLGRVGIVKKRAAREGAIGKRAFKETHPCFEVIERIKKTVAWLDRRDTSVVDYAGDVHCVSVPYHTLYVRRRGKPLWCGNTLMFWSSPNNMFNSTLKKMEPKLAAENYVGYIDLNCIVNANGVYPLEFTARFGYPTIAIQQEGIVMPISEFLYGLATGTLEKFKTRTGFQIGVRIVVPPFPFKDRKTFEVNSKDAVIMFKKPSPEGIHIEDVKLVNNNEWVVTGTSGVILIVVGTGSTVKQTQKNVYNKVDNIMIPNMYYRTDIGDKWAEDSDKLHNWGYLREG